MTVKDLKGRLIEDVPYSGLVESLCKITLMCHTVGEAQDSFSSEDLLQLMIQVSEVATEGMVFAGATREEINTVTKYLVSGMSVGREPLN